MGIRGLTSFVEQNRDRSFIPYRLHNCNLVIDGNSAASQLYVRGFGKSNSKRCAFGGDYDEYARYVKRFFILLSCCKVKPIVIFDGGKEPRKSATRMARLKGAILAAGRLRPDSCSDCPLPLLMLEVFKWVATRSGAIIGVCCFEADEEIAALARALSCPLLSFDSDFYIHAVPSYIPFPMLATELTEESSAGSILRYLECNVFSVDKFLSRSDVGDWRKKSRGSKNILQVEVLPLIAALLGNDYVKPNTFRHFLSKIPVPKSKCRSYRQRTIVGLLEWLRLEESLESAIKKILSHTKKGQRNRLEKIIQETVNVYVGCPSELLQQLNLSPPLSSEITPVDTEVEVADSILKFIPNVKEEGQETGHFQVESVRSSDENECPENMEHESPIHSAADSSEYDDQLLSEENIDGESDSEEALDSDCALDEQDDAWNERRSQLPLWFLERFRKCDLPPCFMDIMMQRTYLCPPQVEDQSQPHSHAISFPILSAIVRLLTPTTETPLVCLTRVNRHAASLALDPHPKNSTWPDPKNLLKIPTPSRIQILLESLNLIDDHEEKNTARKLALESLPSDWRLLALSLAYWQRNSSLHNKKEHFLIAACFCIVLLRVIDVRAGPPGRRSRKVRKDKNMLHLRQAVGASEANLQGGTEKEDFDELSKQNSDTCSRVHIKTSIPEQVSRREQVEMENSQKSVKELMQLVSTADCVRVNTSDGKLIQLRQVDEDTGRGAFLGGHQSGRKRPRTYNLTTVHCFSELQSVILHVGYLNSLLGEPFVSNAPHTSFSGTTLYNALYDVHGKSFQGPLNKSVWEILLGVSAPSLENLMDAFFKCVYVLTWGVYASESCGKKKSKKRNGNKKRVVKENNRNLMENSEQESEETLYDPENKYSLLNSIELKR